MSEGQKMTEAEVKAILDKIWGPPRPKPKPKVVTSDAQVIRDAIVTVGPDDPNYKGSDEGVVKVRRSDFVTVRIDLWEEQQWPAPGSEDTELGVLMELEVGHGETEVYPRIQA
jgi:hypothetical protein